MADQMDGKGRPPKRRSGLTRGQKGLIAAAAVLAVALAGVLAWADMADTASSAATEHASIDLFKMIISVG